MNLDLITSQLKNEYPNININENQKIINPELVEENIEFFKTIINYNIIIIFKELYRTNGHRPHISSSSLTISNYKFMCWNLL